jgi:hypothetical protein
VTLRFSVGILKQIGHLEDLGLRVSVLYVSAQYRDQYQAVVVTVIGFLVAWVKNVSRLRAVDF